jgi:WD40 repeat protein
MFKLKYQFTVILFIIAFAAYTQPEIVINKGHTSMVNCIAYSDDGKWQATSGVDKQLVLWDYNQRKVYRDFESRRDVYDIKISEPFLGVLYMDSLQVWDFYTGEVVYEHAAAGGLNNMIMNDGVLIYNSNDGKTIKYDLINNQEKIVITGGHRIALDGDVDDILTYDILKKQLEVYDGNFNLKKNISFDYVIKIDYDAKKRNALIQTGPKAQILSLRNYGLVDLPQKPLGTAYDFKDGKFCYLQGMTLKVVSIPKFSKIADIHFSMQPMGVAFHPQKNIIALGENKGIVEYDLKTSKPIYQYENKIHAVTGISMSQDNKYLAISSDFNGFGTKIWSVKKNNLEYTFSGLRYPIHVDMNGILKAPALNGLNQICAYDIRFKESKGCQDLENIAMNSCFASQANIYVYAIYNDSRTGVSVYFKDIDKNKDLGKFDVEGLGSLVMDVSPNGNIVALATTEGLFWINRQKKEVKKSAISFDWIFDLEFQTNEIVYAAAITKIRKIDVESDKEIGNFDMTNQGRLEHVSVSGQYVLASINPFFSNSHDFAKIWKEDKENCTIDVHNGAISDALFIENKNRFYTASVDGSIAINDLKACEPVAKLIPYGSGNDFIITTEDNYYMASKQALDAVSFRHKGELIPFEQFDLILNRPDIVAQRLNNSSSSLIQAYRRAYARRLKKVGFSEEQLSLDLQLPYIKIVDFQEFVTDKTEVELELNVGDSANVLNRLMVYSNGVPLDGVKGKDLNNLKTKGKDVKYKVPLIPGKNHIEVSVLNDKGVESIPRNIDVIRKTEEDQNLYLITIGVSDYQNDTFDLDYPVKDAQDLKKFFEGNQNLYDNIYKKEFLNEDVTLEELEQIEEFLKNVKLNDVVLIFVAGHGLLDENYNYYFGTHDMDFNNPALRGLSIEWLEQLMDKIKSLKKILFLDTCHSGEVEEDEVEIGEADLAMLDNVKVRVAGVGVRRKKGLGLFNSVELMQVLFADLRKGSGATILSSAGGAEYAYESSEWNNGLFTFCLLEGLKTKAADLNKDGSISTQEIKSYVSDKVDKLSAGKQKPTSRSENIYGTFRVW